MPIEETASAMDISASALSAQRKRMSVIAGNIANANSLVTTDGGPYRRREVTFATVMKGAFGGAGGKADRVGGVTIASVSVSKEPLKTIHDPQHPRADKDGFVKMPNVNITKEMVDMVAAQRAYEANLAAMKAYRDMLRNSIGILKF